MNGRDANDLIEQRDRGGRSRTYALDHVWAGGMDRNREQRRAEAHWGGEVEARHLERLWIEWEPNKASGDISDG